MWDDILRLCDDALSMKIMAMCRVQGFKHPVFESDELVIKPPGISCKVRTQLLIVIERTSKFLVIIIIFIPCYFFTTTQSQLQQGRRFCLIEMTPLDIKNLLKN